MRLHLPLALVGLSVLAFAMPSFAKDDPGDETVVCKDGSTSKGGRGACRGHGGVDKAATAKAAGGAAAAATAAKGESAKASMERGQAKAAAKADEKAAGVTVVCKDGATSTGGRGACRGHGGVDKAATAKATRASATTAAPATPPTMPPAATPAVPPTPATRATRATPPAPAAASSAATQRPDALARLVARKPAEAKEALACIIESIVLTLGPDGYTAKLTLRNGTGRTPKGCGLFVETGCGGAQPALSTGFGFRASP